MTEHIATKHFLPITSAQRRRSVSLCPGPVEVASRTRAVLARPSVSHRGATVIAAIDRIRDRLLGLTRARFIQLMAGSGTTANDAIAAQLGLRRGPGLVLSNGEFGQRLIDHARRHGLNFETLVYPWGSAFDYAAIARRLATGPALDWIWFVHCETSTAVLNDLGRLQALATRHGAALAVDTISSIGTVDVDLRDVAFATAVSGKGLAAYAGLALVCHNSPIEPRPDRLPRCLDLGYYQRARGTAFTIASNLILALAASVENRDFPVRFARIESMAVNLREQLDRSGYRQIGVDESRSPAVTTVALPGQAEVERLVAALDAAGFVVQHQSSYLRKRNWVQFCLMGDIYPTQLAALHAALAAYSADPVVM